MKGANRQYRKKDQNHGADCKSAAGGSFDAQELDLQVIDGVFHRRTSQQKKTSGAACCRILPGLDPDASEITWRETARCLQTDFKRSSNDFKNLALHHKFVIVSWLSLKCKECFGTIT
jgi:hypothetical protein